VRFCQADCAEQISLISPALSGGMDCCHQGHQLLLL